jgi:toxin CcdB
VAKYDLYPAFEGAGCLLDVQSDLLELLNVRVVVPLIPADQAPAPAKRLNPVFDLEDVAHVMVTQYLAAVPVASLGPSQGRLEGVADEVTRALDMLFQGF